MKIKAYGKLLEVLRENEEWVIYVLGEGKKYPTNDIVIPPELSESEALQFIEDMFHERARPGNNKVIIIE